LPSRPLTLQAKLFRGLSDNSGLSIHEALRTGPLKVGESLPHLAFVSRMNQTTCGV
jgi:hypothetical protein